MLHESSTWVPFIWLCTIILYMRNSCRNTMELDSYSTNPFIFTVVLPTPEWARVARGWAHALPHHPTTSTTFIRSTHHPNWRFLVSHDLHPPPCSACWNPETAQREAWVTHLVWRIEVEEEEEEEEEEF